MNERLHGSAKPDTDDLRPVSDEMEDSRLVKLAQSGDREAFGELIRRHRGKIYGYARTITQDPFHAEDIVQDALIKAFLHVGSLVETGRFLPWLHRIVRNEAYAKLRSHPLAREKTFTALTRPGPGADDETEAYDLERIFHRLSRHEGDGADPEERLMRRELLETIAGLVRCLKPRERQIFESHFFGQLSPREIARLFRLSSANVYQILSRSKKKIVQQKLRVTVDRYMTTRKETGNMKKAMLPKPGADCGTWTSAAAAMHGLVTSANKPYTLPMVMGLTGHAFRITILGDDVHIAGPTLFDFKEMLTKGMMNLGVRVRVVDGLRDRPGPNANLVDPDLLTASAKEKRNLHEALPAALELIHRSIDRGYPVLSWDLSMPEFGLIYGYDDERRTLAAMEYDRDISLPYDHLGRGVLEELFVLAPEEPFDIDLRTSFRGALNLILNHYRGREEQPDRCKRGLEAYDAWMDAFRGGNVEPNGNAYNAAVVQDARRLAAKFFAELGAAWPGDAAEDERIRRDCREASALYGNLAEQLSGLGRLFPFPAGGEPNDPANAARAVAILQAAKTLEERAVTLLERMQELLDR